MIVTLLLTIATILSGYSLPAIASYIRIEECQVNDVCFYTYHVDQEFSQNASRSLTFSASIEVTCHSTGQFNNTIATQYCMTVTEAEVAGEIFNITSVETKRKQEEHVNELLSGWFCFVQTEDGKIVSVQHARDEEESAIDVKKSIAAAFQANFKGTEEETESDPQSDHISHYRYMSNDTHAKKMHRHIEGDDVLGYSSGADKKNVKLLKDETIEYIDGFLYNSSGTVEINLIAKNDNEETEQHSISKAFVAQGSYSLVQQQCTVTNNHVQSRHRRSMNEKMNKGLSEESLKVYANKKKQLKEKISFIRETDVPNIDNILRKLHKNPTNLKLFDLLGQLLELEHQYYLSFKEHTESPALSNVLSYLSMIQYSQFPQDVKMRETIYALLSIEGSLQSQMVLFEALQVTISGIEKEAIIEEIYMIKNPHMIFITNLHNYLQGSLDLEEKNALLLSFGALASRAQPEAEITIVNVLLKQLNRSSDTNETFVIAHLLLSLGNTGSKHTVSSILSYLNFKTRDVQEAAIVALLKFVYIKEVQDALQELIASNYADEEILNMVLRTLIKGELYAMEMDIDIEIDFSHPLYSTLVTAILSTNDTELISQVSMYIKRVGGEQAIEMFDRLHIRHKRGTDWDAHNSNYDCVASQSSRADDVAAYPKHKAYIYAKKLGTSDINMQIGAGVFEGMSNDHSNMKGFARACARGKFFSRRSNLAEIEFRIVKTGASINRRAYIQYGGFTKLNSYASVDVTAHCMSYDNSLYKSRQRLFHYIYSFWIYVGTIDASVSLYSSLNVKFEAQICGNIDINEQSSGTVAVIPQVSLTVEGSASYTFIQLARVGLSVDATIAYQLEPRGTVKGCITSNHQTCIGMYDSWPGNIISLYAWYQTRKIKWCRTGGWIKIKYPCGFSWGGRNKWSPLSWSWSVGGKSRSTIAEICYPSQASINCPEIPWPNGQYSLIQALTGCPTGMLIESRYIGKEDTSLSANIDVSGSGSGEQSNEITTHADIVRYCGIEFDAKDRYKAYFCIKMSTLSGTYLWPSGTYCIGRYNDKRCPSSFFPGLININNYDNDLSVPVPNESYSYSRNSRQIHFCCRRDGNHSRPLYLPSSQAFTLYRFGGQCQKVARMNEPKELSIQFDSCSGSHSDGPCGSADQKLTVCYYSPYGN